MSIKTILVPTDFSEHSQRAFEQACDLASQLRSKVYLLCVQTENALRTAIKEGLMDSSSTDDEVRNAVEQLIAQRFSQTIPFSPASVSSNSGFSIKEMLRS